MLSVLIETNDNLEFKIKADEIKYFHDSNGLTVDVIIEEGTRMNKVKRSFISFDNVKMIQITK